MLEISMGLKWKNPFYFGPFLWEIYFSCVKRPSRCPIWWNNVVCWRNPKQLPLLLMPIVHYTGTWWQAKWVCNSISLSSVMPLWWVRPSLNAKCLPSRSLRWVSWAGHQCSYFRKKSLKKLCFIPPTRWLVQGNWKVSTGSKDGMHWGDKKAHD